MTKKRFLKWPSPLKETVPSLILLIIQYRNEQISETQGLCDLIYKTTSFFFVETSSVPPRKSSLRSLVRYRVLLHIMCGYQCDKSMTKNDTREVIFHCSEMISYHFTAPGVKFGGKICFLVLSKWPLQDLWIYYMEESVLLGTKPLVDSIRHFIRDPSGVFSVWHLCECRIVQWRHDSRLLFLLNWFFVSRLFSLHIIKRTLHVGSKIWILCSRGTNNISRVSAANEWDIALATRT